MMLNGEAMSSGPSLDLDTINALLSEAKKINQRSTSNKSENTTSTHPKPIQVGPLHYRDETNRCASRGCGTQCLIEVSGIPYCSSHALYELNRLLLDKEGFDYSDCNCKAGAHSKMNVHTSDCPVWARVKEGRIDNNSTESA